MSDADKLHTWCQSGAQGMHIFLFKKDENDLNRYICNISVKYVKQWKSYNGFKILTWIPAKLQYFNNVYISDGVKTDLLTYS